MTETYSLWMVSVLQFSVLFFLITEDIDPVGYYGQEPKALINLWLLFIIFRLVGFYDISTLVGYLIPNPFYTCDL